MADFRLDSVAQYSQRPSMSITWTDSDGAAFDLTGATLSGTIRSAATGEVRAIAGDLVITDAADGVFRWDFDAADVADAGGFRVQFSATFSTGQTPAYCLPAQWQVRESQVVPN